MSIPHLLIILLATVVLISAPATAQRYAVTSGNWSSTSTWAVTSGGVAGASVPAIGDAVTIERGYTITVDIPNGSDCICAKGA